eukprot:TRINITY_DN5289_c0_g1_i1.p1 TRINITY_DN5289_c0_g1~~TRINITY_DN5289_c0_g1_i1.p1  ORF type:complete len:164 (+),score=15.55 TRINITY_DN5289_c0_g1_i1:29-493(+)
MKLLLVCIVLATVAIHVLGGAPSCVTSACCNFCNETYKFSTDCNTAWQAVYAVATNSSNSPYYSIHTNNSTQPVLISITHLTISDCCPPFYHYHEDMLITFTNATSSCIVTGYSHSWDGTCDIGGNQENIDTLLAGTTLDYTGPIFNAGCEGHK